MFESSVSLALNTVLNGNYFSGLSLLAFNDYYNRINNKNSSSSSAKGLTGNCWNLLNVLLDTLGYSTTYLTQVFNVDSIQGDDCHLILYSTIPSELNIYKKRLNQWQHFQTKQSLSSEAVQSQIHHGIKTNDSFATLLVAGSLQYDPNNVEEIVGEIAPHFILSSETNSPQVHALPQDSHTIHARQPLSDSEDNESEHESGPKSAKTIFSNSSLPNTASNSPALSVSGLFRSKVAGYNSASDAILNSITDYAIYQLDRNGCIRSWNAGAHRLIGYAAAEVLGKHFSLFYPPVDVQTRRAQEHIAIAAKDSRFEGETCKLHALIKPNQ
jgi:PAS domain-containing protein